MSEPINNSKKVVLDGYRFSGKSVGAVSTRYSGRHTFFTAVTFEQVVRLFPKVSKDKPHERNRAIDVKRAKAAGQYWLDNPSDWIFPPLILTLDDDLNYEIADGFDVRSEGLDLQMVKITLPHDFAKQAFLADGQHRVFGIDHIFNECMEKLQEAKKNLKIAKESGERPELVTLFEAGVAGANAQILRFETETIGVQIITNANENLQKKWFGHMSHFQREISRGEGFRIDHETKLSIVARQVISNHPLLAGEFPRRDAEIENPRVNLRKDNVVRGSDSIYTLANIRDWIATLVLGSKLETSIGYLDEVLNIDQVTDLTNVFFNTLIESVSYFEKLKNATLLGKEFRQLTGFSSPTIIRGLALAANQELVKAPSFESADSVDLIIDENGLSRFKKLLVNLEPELEYIDDPKRTKPQKKKMKQDNWYASQLFRDGATAPQSGFQDRSRLGAMLIAWSEKGKIDFTNFVVTSESV